MSEKLYLNLGCGDTTPEGWVNCDSSWHAQISRISGLHSVLRMTGLVSSTRWPTNVRHLRLGKRWPWTSGTVDCVYGSHVFEHLSDQEADNFMGEATRVLKPGGVLRIVVPDLHYHATKYLQSFDTSASAAEEFLQVMNLRFRPDKNVIRSLYGLINGQPHLHKNMYDRHTLSTVFMRHGFAHIHLSEYGRSAYLTNVQDVEGRDQGYEGSLYLEGCKP
jgi:predicted SAM-dependent methyltransferase